MRGIEQISQTRSRFPLFFPPCKIFLSHTPVAAIGKDKKQPIRDVIIMLKLRHLVASQHIHDFWKSYPRFSNINEVLSGEQEKESIIRVRM